MSSQKLSLNVVLKLHEVKKKVLQIYRFNNIGFNNIIYRFNNIGWQFAQSQASNTDEVTKWGLAWAKVPPGLFKTLIRKADRNAIPHVLP